MQLLDFEYVPQERLSFVLEYANGGELFSLIKRFGVLPEHVVKIIARQLIDGVRYLHSIGVVHRDIKLENILLLDDVLKEEEVPSASPSRRSSATTTPKSNVRAAPQASTASVQSKLADLFDPSKPTTPAPAATTRTVIDPDKIHIKIADFGLSRLLSSEESLMSTMCGTPIYVAPEVTTLSLRANRSGYTAAADMWSVGVVCYALLCGRPPFPHARDEYGRKHKTRINYNHPMDWSIAQPIGGASHDPAADSPGVVVGHASPRSCPASPQNRRILGGVANRQIKMVSTTARSFLESLLQMRPEHRASASEALAHPWLSCLGEEVPQPGDRAGAVSRQADKSEVVPDVAKAADESFQIEPTPPAPLPATHQDRKRRRSDSPPASDRLDI